MPTAGSCFANSTRQKLLIVDFYGDKVFLTWLKIKINWLQEQHHFDIDFQEMCKDEEKQLHLVTHISGKRKIVQEVMEEMKTWTENVIVE